MEYLIPVVIILLAIVILLFKGDSKEEEPKGEPSYTLQDFLVQGTILDKPKVTPKKVKALQERRKLNELRKKENQ
jgi:hypothetical protein